MTLVPNETEQALNRQYDVYAEAREEYRKKISEQAARIEQLEREQRDATEEFGILSNDLGQALARIERLEKALRRMVDTYDEMMPMRTADFHWQGCSCMGCARDNARAALEADHA